MIGQASNRHYLNAVLSMVACLAAYGGCWAQPPTPPGNPPALKDGDSVPSVRSEFWVMLGQASKESSNSRRDFWRLLSHPKIQTEVGLEAAELEAIFVLSKKHFEQLQLLQTQLSESSAARDEKLSKLVQVLHQQEAEFIEMLKSNTNLERLIQIDVQAYGIRAVTHGLVAKQIGLSEEKAAELRQLSDEVRREEMDKMGHKIRELMRSPQSDKKVREVIKQLDEKIADALKHKLNSQQLEALNQLKGAAFEIPEDLFDRRLYSERRENKNHSSKDCKE
jgi:hypothetical protein